MMTEKEEEKCSKRNDDERYSAPSPKSEDEVPQLGRGDG